jgi:hypothetical protein
MFGVVNAFASGLAMAGVAIAVWLQRDQVLMQRDQLQLQSHELKMAAKEAKQQTAVLTAQLENAAAQRAREEKSYIERNKPMVFSDRVLREDGVGYDYMIRNVGGGFAVNVYFIAEDARAFSAGELPVRALGSLAPNAEMRFPEILRQAITDSENHPVPHILLAEGPYTRTTQWTATLNYRSALHDRREGHVQHQVATTLVAPPRFQRQSLRTFLWNNLADVQRQLQDLATKPED